MITIDYKQFIRDREWFGRLDWEYNYLEKTGEWGYRVKRDANGYFLSHKMRMDLAMWVITQLNKWV